jgi:quercetin dioxygenase-like cupin family protein
MSMEANRQIYEETAAQVIAPGQARVYQLHLGEARILMDGARSAGEWWLATVRQDPGFVTPLHLHPQMAEHFYILDGALSLYLDGKWTLLEAGTLAIIPHGVAHAQANRGGSPVSTLAWGRPAGFERFFAAQQGAPNLAGVVNIVKDYDTEVLGPPPQ